MSELPPLPVAARGPAPPGSPPPLEEVPHRLSKRVEGVSCPNCGGNLKMDIGLRVVRCPYCATPFLVLSEIGTRRFAVEPRIDAGAARQHARAWLARGVTKDPRLEREAEVGEAFLCFLPFFRVEADAIGFALGTEKRRRTVGSGKNRRTETYEVDVERKVEKSFDLTYPAVNVAEWGIRRVELEGDPLVPFEMRSLGDRGMVFPATGSESQVFAAALARCKASADPASGLHRVRFRYLETLRERLSVVYYPLWVVRYRFRGRAYQVLIDGEDGTLAYGKAPGNDLYRALVLVGTEAAVMYVLTSVIQHLGLDLPGMAFAGAVALGVLWWAWRRFRYGGVVIEGSGVRERDGLGDVWRSLRDPRRLIRRFGRGTAGDEP